MCVLVVTHIYHFCLGQLTEGNRVFTGIKHLQILQNLVVLLKYSHCLQIASRFLDCFIFGIGYKCFVFVTASHVPW